VTRCLRICGCLCGVSLAGSVGFFGECGSGGRGFSPSWLRGCRPVGGWFPAREGVLGGGAARAFTFSFPRSFGALVVRGRARRRVLVAFFSVRAFLGRLGAHGLLARLGASGSYLSVHCLGGGPGVGSVCCPAALLRWGSVFLPFVAGGDGGAGVRRLGVGPPLAKCLWGCQSPRGFVVLLCPQKRMMYHHFIKWAETIRSARLRNITAAKTPDSFRTEQLMGPQIDCDAHLHKTSPLMDVMGPLFRLGAQFAGHMCPNQPPQCHGSMRCGAQEIGRFDFHDNIASSLP